MMRRSFATLLSAPAFAVALAGLAVPAADAAGAPATSRASARTRTVHPHVSPSRHRSDFNGDGYDDLIVPAPGESQNDIARTGAVTVMYGSASGLTATGSVTFTQDSPGVPSAAAKRNFWGRAVATGDFNNDGYDDAAIGSEETIGSAAGAGTLTILFGSAAGLNSIGAPTAQLFTPAAADVPQFQTSIAHFGGSLAVADFNGDGTDDLAVGAPGATIGKAVAAGGVTILTGSVNGLVPTGLSITQGHGTFGTAEFGDFFGTSLAAGDLNGDTFGDLVIGTPGEDAGSVVDVGVVDVLLGAADITQMQDHYFATGDLPAAANRRLGANVAVQTFGGAANGWVYAPGHLSSGWVEIIDLAHSALHVHSSGTAGSQHGISMVFGAFSSGSQASMAIGEPYANNSAGGQVVVRDGANSTVLSQDTNGVFGTSEHGDAFALSLDAGDYNGDGIDELAVGVPFESVGSIYHAGDFYVFPGDALGLGHAAGQGQAQMWYQDTPGIPGTSEARDLWGDLQHGPVVG